MCFHLCWFVAGDVLLVAGGFWLGVRYWFCVGLLKYLSHLVLTCTLGCFFGGVLLAGFCHRLFGCCCVVASADGAFCLCMLGCFLVAVFGYVWEVRLVS